MMEKKEKQVQQVLMVKKVLKEKLVCKVQVDFLVLMEEMEIKVQKVIQDWTE
jgi:hypothetical protein